MFASYAYNAVNPLDEESQMSMDMRTVVPEARDQVVVTVQYVGSEDFIRSFPGAVAFQAVKVQAMKSFDLEPEAADEYVLQLNDADLPDSGHLRDLHQTQVALTLVRKDEVSKGHDRTS